MRTSAPRSTAGPAIPREDRRLPPFGSPPATRRAASKALSAGLARDGPCSATERNLHPPWIPPWASLRARALARRAAPGWFPRWLIGSPAALSAQSSRRDGARSRTPPNVARRAPRGGLAVEGSMVPVRRGTGRS